MKIIKNYKYLDKIFILSLIATFAVYNLNNISYGLPYFSNPDEMSFQDDVLTSMYFLTDHFELQYNPLYGSLINSIIILNSLFINEFLINSLSLNEIKSKLYFNTELFLLYGRFASLLITTSSIFILYKIFKKLKIDFLIYSLLLITFSTSIITLNIATIFGKNSCNLLIYLVQLYFFLKYILKIDKFDNKSYYLFSILASVAWGVNYWPAFVSIYAVFFLHFIKYKFSKLNYIFIFFIIFIFFGPFINLFFVTMSPLEHLTYSKDLEKLDNIEAKFFFEAILKRIITSLKIIFFSDKNILLLLLLTPFYLIHKYTNYKKEFFIILILIFEPIILFGLSGNIEPQIRYFGGLISLILILTGLVVKEIYKTKFRLLVIFFLITNLYVINENIIKHKKINETLSNNYSFFNFNKNINLDKSKVFYLVDLSFQESLKQNFYYLKLYNNDLIKKNERSKRFFKNIEKKIQKIKSTENILIVNENLKNDIIYFNYTFFPINDLKSFFEFIKKDFDYVVIEESKPNTLSDSGLQIQIRSYVKENFLFKKIHFNNKKIFLRNQQSVMHYYSNALSRYDIEENIYNDKLEVIYGVNYSLYELE